MKEKHKWFQRTHEVIKATKMQREHHEPREFNGATTFNLRLNEMEHKIM